jgi:hypothetical protein
MFDSNLKRMKLADYSWPLASSALTQTSEQGG